MTSNGISEIERIRRVYAARFDKIALGRYTPFDPAHLLLHYSRQRALLDLLKRHEIYSLKGKRILEVGCGAGDILLEYLEYEARPDDLFGIDALPAELVKGHHRSPNLGLACADGQSLPFSNRSFDLVTQYTVFTSILDSEVRKNVAGEMLRVLKPDGLIVFYDFWPNNPRNPDVRGLRVKEIRALFPGCKLDVQHIVLAPPIARRLAPLSSLACQLLEKLPWLCSHYMVGITPASQLF